MKNILAIAMILSSFSTFAASSVYCKVNKKVIDLKSENAYDCAGALYMGEACFTGQRAEVVKFLNSADVRSLYDGTDGEYIADAHFKGKDSVAYTSYDNANEASSKVSIDRCAKGFFAR